MEDKTLEMTMLLDFFGETLTERQRTCCDMYYNEDLSLSEIAELTGITKQGARDLLHRAELALRELEAQTGLVARYLRRREAEQALLRTLEELVGLTEGRAQALALDAAEQLRRLD